MPKFVSPRDLPAVQDAELGASEWRTVDQDRISQFADATDDDQFIHVDPTRAAQTPFGGKIAHGVLTLSLAVTLCRRTF